MRAWVRWGLIALAVVIALGCSLAPAARAVDLVANRMGHAAPDARVAGIPVIEVHISATAGGLAGATFGHSSVAITLSIYSHVLPNMHRDAATAMDELFAPVAATKA